ncbi:MAG: ATP-binding cassette domain-containing protein [Vicinamibacterales bacterium]
MTSPSTVEFEQVHFAHAPRSPILQGISLTCRTGETVAIVGRSGAGKTTLLRLVNRLIDPSSGVVRVQGRETTAWNPIALRRTIGYVMQDAGLFPHMTVAENVAIVPRLERWTPERIEARVRELLELVGLDAAVHGARRPSELSGGQRQRVGLARALAVEPAVLLMDEPFGALDPITRRDVRREFALLRHRLKTTTLIVTHDVDEAMMLADRLAVLDAGRLIALDTPDALRVSSDRRVRALIEEGE